MPDISMCTNKKCKIRLTCYRFTAIPYKHLQSYAEFKAKDCEYYWSINSKNK